MLCTWWHGQGGLPPPVELWGLSQAWGGRVWGPGMWFSSAEGLVANNYMRGPWVFLATVPFGDPRVICGNGSAASCWWWWPAPKSKGWWHQSLFAQASEFGIVLTQFTWLQWWEVDGILALLFLLSCMCWPAQPSPHLERGQKGWEGTPKGYEGTTNFLDH